MSIDTIIIFAIAILLLYIKPGPNQAIKITKALDHGFLPAWFFTLGATSMVSLYFICAALGMNFAQNFIDSVGFYFKIVGGAYLLYLGYKGLSNLEKGVWSGPKKIITKRDFVENFSLGFMTTLANPITIFFFVGIVPNLMEIGMLDIGGLLVGLAVIWVTGNMADTILIALVVQIREFLSSPAFVRRINIFSSIGFICIGFFFVYSAFLISEFSYTL